MTIREPVEMDDLEELLRRGGVAVVPTDTAYGLVASLRDPSAVQRVFELKGRDPAKSLPVLVRLPEAFELGEFTEVERRAVESFWPGALTLVVPARQPANLPAGVTRDGTVALRAPDHPGLLDLLEAVGPLTGTSANPSGETTPVAAKQIDPGLKDEVEAVVEEGTPGGESSTVARWDVEESEWEVLREGPVTKRQLDDLTLGDEGINR